MVSAISHAAADTGFKGEGFGFGEVVTSLLNLGGNYLPSPNLKLVWGLGREGGGKTCLGLGFAPSLLPNLKTESIYDSLCSCCRATAW